MCFVALSELVDVVEAFRNLSSLELPGTRRSLSEKKKNLKHVQLPTNSTEIVDLFSIYRQCTYI